MIELDVLIVGGGPAGLLTASYLAETRRVGLIERGILGRTTKYWVTTERRLQKHGLSEYIRYRPPGMFAGTFLGAKVATTGDLAVVDDGALLRSLVNRCKERDVLLAEKTTLINLSWKSDRIHIETTNLKYASRLLADASGGTSQLANTFRLHKLDGFFSVYGAHLAPIRLDSPNVVLAYVSQLGDPPPILELIPTSEESAFCALFIYSKNVLPPQSLKSLFDKHCNHNPFFNSLPSTKATSGKIGLIPIGRFHHKQLPGVVTIGEASLRYPPLLATAFNDILEYGREDAATIDKALGSTTGLPIISQSYPLLKRLQDRFQLTLIRWLLDRNVVAFDALLRLIAELPSATTFDLCSNELTWSQLLGIAGKLPFSLLRRVFTSDVSLPFR